MTCRDCGEVYPAKFKYCPCCGMQLVPPDIYPYYSSKMPTATEMSRIALHFITAANPNDKAIADAVADAWRVFTAAESLLKSKYTE